MPSKHSAQIFQKRHFDPDRFIETGDTPGPSSPEPVSLTETVASGSADDATSEHRLLNAGAHIQQAQPTGKSRKIAMTYKHKEQNYDRLKFLSQRLKITMGQLIDEALEAKFAEWRSRVPPDPEF